MPRTPVPPLLHVQYADLEDISKWPGNPKEHDIGAIAASVLKHGFRDPIAVNSRTSMIEEGHGRLDTLRGLKQQGRPAPAFVQVETDGRWLVPVIYFDDDDMTAASYALAHNRTQELGGGYDDERLYAALRAQAETGLLDGTGFDADDVEALRRKLEGERVGDQSAEITPQYQLLITCVDEAHQAQLIEDFSTRGLNFRALVS